MQVNESWWLKLSTVGTIIVQSNFWNMQVNFFFTMLVHKLGKSTNKWYNWMKILFLKLIHGCPASSCQKMVKEKSLMAKKIGLEVILAGITRPSTNLLNRRGSWGNKVIFTCTDNRVLPFHSSVALAFLAAPLCTQHTHGFILWGLDSCCSQWDHLNACACLPNIC